MSMPSVIDKISDRIDKRTETVDKRLEMLDERINLQNYRLFGNGKKGYVRELIEEEIIQLEKRMTMFIETSIRKAFDEQNERDRAKHDARTWAVILLGLGVLFNGLPNFISWLIGMIK